MTYILLPPNFSNYFGLIMPRFPELDRYAKDLVEELKIYKQRMELCLEDNEINDREKQSDKIKIATEKTGLKRLNTSTLSDNEKKTQKIYWTIWSNSSK